VILYHGSNQEIFEIDLAFCKPYKDFGKGFYLTTIQEQAKLMAKRTARIFRGKPVVTAFDYDDSANEGLSVLHFCKATQHWATFVLNNRNRSFEDISNVNCNTDNKYDIVCGPVANDDIALLFRSYSNGLIGIESLAKGLEYRELSNQYSFHTEKALLTLSKRDVIFFE